MPAPSGQFFFEDHVAELRAFGFDGFSPVDLKEYVNRGYFHVARKFPLFWKETTDTFTVGANAYSVGLGTELPNYHSVDRVYLTSPTNNRRKLKVLSDQDFQEKWLPLDLTNLNNRGVPEWYYIYEGRLWVLPPPDGDYSFIAHYHRRPTKMIQDQDLPITPVHLDEAIQFAAKVRCHKRANEPGLAALAEADLQEFFDDMLDDEEMQMAEQQDRVIPDNSWL